MKKQLTVLFSLLLIILLLLLGIKGASLQEKELAEALNVVPASVSEISLTIPSQPGSQKTTTDKKKIEELMDYFSRVKYKRLRGDVSAYMPRKAGIIYLYQDTEEDFIVFFGKEAMISQKVYQIKNGNLDETFLTDFYHSLEINELGIKAHIWLEYRLDYEKFHGYLCLNLQIIEKTLFIH